MDDLRTNSNAGATEERDPFLVALGERIRSLRARKGMTRRALANASSVSERHLANLELGVGNAFVLVLRQIAQALGCPLAEMLGDETAGSPEWLLIRELLRGRDDADLRRAGSRFPSCSARRDSRRHARGGSRSSACAAQASPRSARCSPTTSTSRSSSSIARSSGSPAAASPRSTPLRPVRVPALRAARARGRPCSSYPRRGHRDAGRHRLGRGDVQPPALAMLHDLASGDARRAHGSGRCAGRYAADGGHAPRKRWTTCGGSSPAAQAFYGKADLSFDTSGKALAQSFAQLHGAVRDALAARPKNVRRSLTAGRGAHAAECIIDA